MIQFTPASEGETTDWGDMPASYHNNACGYSFADGHALIHHWVVASTSHPVVGNESWLPMLASPNTDLLWVESRASPQTRGLPSQVPAD
jgi:prepilin-type processing-associated H-X9-DG protein